MGVRGLTTYIRSRSDLLKHYELKNSHLVIDGNSLSHHLYKTESQLKRCNDCFGGDYDKYGIAIREFFQGLSHCNITPIVVFNGGREEHKFITGITDLQRNIASARSLDNTTKSHKSVYYPLLVKQTFLQMVLDLNIQCVRCNYDGDSEIAFLANALQCPVLSNDSDFFIFDVIFIPLASFFATRQIRYSLQTKIRESFIKCSMYKVSDFLNVFGMEKANLPILAILLGNDSVNPKLFSPLFDVMKVPKLGTKRELQKAELVISWLKHENHESIVQKILNCYNGEKQVDIREKMVQSSLAYAMKQSDIINYLDLDITLPEVNSTFDEIRIIDGDNKNIEEKMNSINRTTSENNDSSKNSSILASLPLQFICNYRKCKLPSHFMTLLTLNKHCISPQIEDFSEENAHSLTLPILKVIYKILTLNLPESCPLTIYIKNEHSNGVKKCILEESEQGDLPSLKMIYELSSLQHREIFLRLLNINKVVIENLQSFPGKWHLILITFDYWTRNSNVEDCFVYAIVLCAIVLSYVDINIHKQRLFRSWEDFSLRYNTEIDKALNSLQTDAVNKICNVSLTNINSSLEDINYVESILCMDKLITYFETDVNNGNGFDRNIVHKLAQFQSCLLRISHLNDLLNKPIDNILPSEFYNGTFLYNVLVSFKKVENNDLKDHLKSLLKNCPKISRILEVIVDSVITPNKDNECDCK